MVYGILYQIKRDIKHKNHSFLQLELTRYGTYLGHKLMEYGYSDPPEWGPQFKILKIHNHKRRRKREI